MHSSQPEIGIVPVAPLAKKLSENSFSLLDDEDAVQIQHHQNANNGMHKKKHNHCAVEIENGLSHVSVQSQKGSHANENEDEFSDYVEAASPMLNQTQSHNNNNNNNSNSNSNNNNTHPNNHLQQHNHSHSHNNHSQSEQKDPSKMSFDELLKTPQLCSSHSQQQSVPLYSPQQSQWGVYGAPQSYSGFAANHHYSGYVQPQAYNQGQFVNQFAHNPYIGYAPRNNLHAAYSTTQSASNNGYVNFTLH